MKLRFLVPALAVVLTTAAAHAQIGLYLNPVVSRIGISTPDTGPFAFLGQNTTSRIFGGVDFGGYYTFAHYPKSNISVDLRDTIQHGNSASLNSFLFGIRASANPMVYSFQPYVQLSIGEGRSKSPLSPIHVSKLEYDIFGGIDKSISKHVDWRVVEIGYGSVQTISSQIYSGPTIIPSASLLNFSTGLVFRIR